MIFAVYPATYHDRVVVHCMQHQVQKAFGKAGNMVNVLSGEGWTPQWEQSGDSDADQGATCEF